MPTSALGTKRTLTGMARNVRFQGQTRRTLCDDVACDPFGPEQLRHASHAVKQSAEFSDSLYLVVLIRVAAFSTAAPPHQAVFKLIAPLRELRIAIALSRRIHRAAVVTNPLANKTMSATPTASATTGTVSLSSRDFSSIDYVVALRWFFALGSRAASARP